jgi:hypothetical protein
MTRVDPRISSPFWHVRGTLLLQRVSRATPQLDRPDNKMDRTVNPD